MPNEANDLLIKRCARCGEPIPAYNDLCSDCMDDMNYEGYREKQELHERYAEAADRLESQRREIERLKAENKSMNDHVLVATGVAGFFAGYAPVTICGIPIADAVTILSNHGALAAKLAAETARADAAAKDCETALFAVSNYSVCHLCQFVARDGYCARKGVGAGCKPKWRGAQEDAE